MELVVSRTYFLDIVLEMVSFFYINNYKFSSFSQKILFLFLFLFFVLPPVILGSDEIYIRRLKPNYLPPDKLFTASFLKPPGAVAEEEYTWEGPGSWAFRKEEDINLFSYISPSFNEVKVIKNRLYLKAASGKGFLVIGNYYKNSMPTHLQKSLPNRCRILVYANQTKKAVWKVTPTLQGKPIDNNTSTKATSPMKWIDWRGQKVLSDREWVIEKGVEGFMLEITGAPGNEILIERIACARKEFGGYYRREFELPHGPVFQAWMTIGQVCNIEINGQKITGFTRPFLDGAQMYWTRGIDISPYLVPGKNCIGLSSWREGSPPFIYCQGQVIMASGEEIPLDTDKTWLFSRHFKENWSRPEFDDRSWKTPKAERPYFEYLKGKVPAYSGPLMIKNPYEEKLFFDNNQDVLFQIQMPKGLQHEDSEIRYTVKRISAENTIFSGKVPVSKANDLLALFNINVGRMERGVYTLSIDLFEGRKKIAVRQDEPFIVVGDIPQPEMTAVEIDNYLAGSELVDSIDCTDPTDPHPYLEGGDGNSKIVRHGKLVYREAGPAAKFGRRNDTSYFMYKIPIKHRDEPHLFVLEYPDNKERWIEFSIMAPVDDPHWQKTKGKGDRWSMARASTGAICGGRFSNSNRMQHLSLLYFANEPEVYACVNTGGDNRPAAASRILVYRLKTIPKLRMGSSNERFIGIHSERGYSFRNMAGRRGRSGRNHMHDWYNVWSPDHFAFWFEAIERYTQYLRFSGHNLHVMGCYQYNERNTPYILNWVGETSRFDPDYRDLMVRIFNANGISTLAGIEFALPESLGMPWLNYLPSDTEMAKGAETIYSVANSGEQIVFPGQMFGNLPNIFHPAVQDIYLQVFQELGKKFGKVPGFKGFYCVDGAGLFGYALPGRHFLKERREAGFGDYTISLFEQDTGINIPVENNDYDRFQKRYRWLMKNAEKEWVEWRCQKIFELRKEILNRIRAYNQNLKLFVSYRFPPDIKDLRDSGLSFKDYIKWDGQDLDLYRDSKDIIFARYGYVGGGRGPQKYETSLEVFESPDIISAFEGFTSRAVCINSIFHENLIKNDYSKQWPWSEFFVMGPPFPEGRHRGWTLARTLAQSDPDTIVLGWSDDDIFPGHESALRYFAQSFLALPRERFQDIQNKNIDSALILRLLNKGERSLFYILNQTSEKGRVKLLMKSDTFPIDSINGRLSGQKRPDQSIQCDFTITPYGLRSFIMDKSHVKIQSVQFHKDNGL